MTKAKIVLLNPPTAVTSSEPILSLGFLAASLRKEGHKVIILDATAPYKKLTEKQVKEKIINFKPNFIGVTLTIVCIAQTYKFLKRLRKLKIPIVAGGPHPNCRPEEVLNNGVDVVAIGEGEKTIVELADYYLGNRTLETVKGICFKKKNGKSHYTSRRELINNLDEIMFPDFSDFPIKNYTGKDDPNSNPIFWSLFSSRGCPFNCIFCSSHNVFGRTYRLRTAENVFKEIKELHDRFGAKRFAFQDDEILCSKKRFMELCDLIINSGLDISMSLRTRISSIDEELLTKAKKAGLRRIGFGIESFNDDTLKKINKMYEVKVIREKMGLLKKTNFKYIYFNNIYGFPWETQDHVNNNLVEIESINKYLEFFTSVVNPVPYPGTKLYDDYHEEYGFTDWWLKPDNHSSFTMPKTKPYYYNFARSMYPLYIESPYWNYSHKTKKEINNFCWGVFKIFMKRHYNEKTANKLIRDSIISYVLWKISPAMENIIFSGKKSDIKLKEFIEAISYTTK